MLQERHISVWNNCLNFIQQNIDPKQFNVWFRPIKPMSLVDSTLTVAVPSEFFREYLEDAYLDILKASLKKELGVAVIFVGEDLDVLIELCDRILVIGGGHITGTVDARNTTKEEIGLLMTKTVTNKSEEE